MKTLPPPVVPGQPPSALAPMQDVTTLPFMRVVAAYGAPDYFFTEYFRVHENSRLEPHILSSITENRSDRPVFAQLIGENLGRMAETARELQDYPIAGVDLNMGCPAPKVYKKNVGGGLLRDVDKVDALLGVLREACPGRFTVKMRIGFDSDENFAAILELINRHGVDCLSLHARTVKEMYRSEVHYEYIRAAVEAVRCPVLANGNISSAAKAEWTLRETGAYGVMIGRNAIRNPWIFRQLREHWVGQSLFRPTLSDVRDYIDRLWVASQPKAGRRNDDGRRVSYLKKFLNFVGQSVDPEGRFLKEMRRARQPEDFFEVCERHLSGENAALPFANEPYEGLIARPSRESDPPQKAKACSLDAVSAC